MKNYNLISTASKSKQKIPHCIHGPNLLLEDLNEQIPEYRRKWVCSAIRTNDCKPFLNFDPEMFKERHFLKRKNFQNRLIQTLKLDQEKRRWCVDCSLLVLPNELEEHQDHFLKENLTIKQLKKPTKLISANVDKKEEAQYFFSEESLKVILKTIIRSKFTHVLCIGCPSIHEELTSRSKRLNIQSFLLDIDSRYLQFYTSKQYLCFNMANNFLFEKDKYEKNLNDFLSSSSKLLVIADPPFGIMIPALADTLIRLKKKINYFKKDDNEFKMNVMLFHLYFYEKRILNVLPELKMMDYKIGYSNHKKLKEDSNSIARLFTDIDGKQIVLKGLNGYKFCEKCERWVHEIANHCEDCKNCMSKNGKESAHCSLCDRCFQIDWEHCFTCEICCRKGECKCGFNLNNKLVENEFTYSDDELNENNYHREEFKISVNSTADETAVSNHTNGESNNVDEIKESDHQETDKEQFVNHRSESNNFGQSNGFRGNNNNFRGNNFKRVGNGGFNKDRSFNREGGNFNKERSFNREGRNFNKDRGFNREGRSFNKERSFNREGGSFNKERSFNREGGSFNKERSFNREGGNFNKSRGFNREGGNFNKDRGFNRNRSFNRDSDSNFGREKSTITKDDFNNMFFSKNGSKSRSFGGGKRSKSSNNRSFKRGKFGN